VPIGSQAQSVQWATQISAGPPSEQSQELNFLISQVATTNPALFSVTPAIDPTGVLTYTPAPGQMGTATFSVALHDNGGTANGGSDTSAAQTFTISVNGSPVANNHSYVLSVGGSSSASANAGVVVGDTDPAGLPLSA